jgi:hypothetical protein
MPLAVSSDFGCSYSSNGQAGPAAAALQLQAAAPALLDLSLSSLSLSDRNLNGSLASSLASSSPSRTSSLLHGSFGSLVSNSSSGGGSPSTSSWSSEAAAAAAAAVVECGSIAELSAQQLLDVDEEGPLVHNHFCRQEMSVALNATVTVLLNTLRSRQYAAENVSAWQWTLGLATCKLAAGALLRHCQCACLLQQHGAGNACNPGQCQFAAVCMQALGQGLAIWQICC